MLVIDSAKNIEQLLHHTGLHNLLNLLTPFSVSIDGKVIQLQEYNHEILLNDQPATLYSLITDGDHIRFQAKNKPTVRSIAEHLNLLYENRISITFQGQQLELSNPYYDILVNGQTVDSSSEIQNKDAFAILTKRNIKLGLF